MDALAPDSREAAAAAMARLDAARIAPELGWRDLAPYAAGNCGIPYAFSFAADAPGPHVAIVGLTHGNEPCGREAIVALLERGVRPLRGRLSLVLGNVAAHAASNGVDPYGTRFVAQDFNRVWSAAILDAPDDNVELARARAIRPLVEAADVLLDLHATPYEACPFFPLRPGPSKARALAERLGQPRTVLDFEQGSVHSPTIANFGRFSDPGSPAVGLTVECGLFFARASAMVALSTVARLLHLHAMIDDATRDALATWHDPVPRRRLTVLSPEVATTTDIRLLFRPESFAPYERGAIVGWDGERPIRAPFDGAVPLWIKQTFVAGQQAFMWARHEVPSRTNEEEHVMTITRRHLLAGASALGLSGLARQAAAQQRSVTFVGWSQDEAASRPVITEMLDAYRSANQGVRLEVIGFPWAQMQQNLILRMRSNQPLDVAQLAERWLPTFAALGNLTDMDALLGKAALEEKIDSGLLRIGQSGGKQLGVPWTAGSIGMVANRKVLADAGVREIPTTLDAFVAALRAVKRSNPESVPYALCTKNNLSMSPDFQVWLWTFGGRLFDDAGAVTVNSEAGTRAMSFLVDLMKENLAARDIDRPDARRLFAQNRTALYADAPIARGFARDNSGQGRAFDQHVAAAPYPIVRSGANPLSVQWGHLLVMPVVAGRRPAADGDAARLVQHLAFNDEMQIKYFEAVGLFPVTKTALARVREDAYVTQWAQYARSAEPDEPSKWPNAADLTTIVGEEVQAALLQQKPPAQAVADMARRLEPRMREVRRG